jgi:predicted histidine transporter YuiF (NhaC family)
MRSFLPKSRFSLNYTEMVVGVSDIKIQHSILAGICTWSLLAGYIVFPSAYGAVHNSHVLDKTGDVGKYIQTVADKIPYIFIGSFFCCLSTAGLLWLWWINRPNYIWVSRQIFL